MTPRARFRFEIVSRSSGPVRVSESASVELRRSAPLVWAFMKDPISATVLSDSTVLGARVPGTPDGLGEIQAFVHQGDDGRRGSMLEVVAIEHGRRAVTRSLGSGFPGGGELVIVPRGPDTCHLTQSYWALLPTGVTRRDAKAVEAAYRDSLRDLMRRLEERAADDRLWPTARPSTDHQRF
jgi:hypothetical protein